MLMKEKHELYIFRHGLSYANAVKEHSKIKGLLLYKFLRDPALTRHGIQCCQKNSNLNVDIVLCSSLKRAIETAYYTFPTKEIFVCPYLCETHPGLENTPLPDKILTRVNYKYVENHPGRNKSSITKFKNFFESKIDKSNIKVAIVCHGTLMRKSLKLDHKPLNNSVYLSKSLEFKKVDMVFSGFSVPDSLTEADIRGQHKIVQICVNRKSCKDIYE